CAVDRRRACIDEVREIGKMSGELQYAKVSDQIGLDIGGRMLDRVADARLCSQVHDRCDAPSRSRCSDRPVSRDVSLCEGETTVAAELGEAGPLQRWVVIAVEAVDPEYIAAAREQSSRDMHSDEAGCAGDEHGHVRRPCLTCWARAPGMAGAAEGMTLALLRRNCRALCAG